MASPNNFIRAKYEKVTQGRDRINKKENTHLRHSKTKKKHPKLMENSLENRKFT